MNKLVILILILSASACAHASAQSLTPAAGAHAVGLRVVQQYDYSRAMDEQLDAFGKPVATPPARPIQALVWYPARRTGAAPMRVADYSQAGLSDVDFALPASAAAKQRAAWMAGPRKSRYDAATLAVRDAASAAGKYPVLIYAPSFAAQADENLDLCEYLASQGYVVIASRSLGARSVVMTDDLEGVEAQAADIAFLINHAHGLPQADLEQVGVIGFSWGGMANVLAAARSSRIKALVSLDGSIRFHPKIWGAAGYLRPARTAVPMLSLGAAAPPAEELALKDKMGPSYLNSMKYSDVYFGTMHPMQHRHFSAMDLRFAGDSDFGDYGRADVVQAYRSVVLYVHRFLDAYLKRDDQALAFIRQSPAKQGIAPQLMAMRFQPASATVPSEAAFLRAFAAAGYRGAQAIHARMREASADFALSPVNLNTLGYQLLRGKNARGAVELFKLATHLEPRFGNAWDSEGEAWEALGDKEQAIKAYEQAVAVDKDQANAIARIKALRAGD
jgi:dienelactone hydrolase